MASGNGYRDAGKERLWRRLVGRHRRSKLSVREFCELERIRESAFYFWRRELARRDEEWAGGEASSSARETSSILAKGRQQNAFLPIALGSPAIEAARDPIAATIEVRLPDGITLRIGSGVDAALLALVLGAVRGEPC